MILREREGENSHLRDMNSDGEKVGDDETKTIVFTLGVQTYAGEVRLSVRTSMYGVGDERLKQPTEAKAAGEMVINRNLDVT